MKKAGGLLRYMTDYTLPNGGRYGSAIMAKDPDDAAHVVALRGIGERVISMGTRGVTNEDQRPSVLLATSRSRALHSALFYGWIAVNAGVATVADLLADDGLVHEISHWLRFGRHKSKRLALIQRWRELERKIPGLCEEA